MRDITSVQLVPKFQITRDLSESLQFLGADGQNAGNESWYSKGYLYFCN